MAQGMTVKADREGWVQGVSPPPGDVLDAPEDEQRRAAAEGARFFADTMREFRKDGFGQENLPTLLKVMTLAQKAMDGFARLKQAENGAMRETRYLARDFLQTPRERAEFIKHAQPNHQGARALPVPKKDR